MAVRTRCEQAADRAVGWLATRLRDDGSYGPDADDLACYYKSPYLFQLSGRPREAARLRTFIKRRFMRPDHDFTTAAGHKSDNAAFTEYWAYPNGRLAMAAHRMGRFGIAYPAAFPSVTCTEPKPPVAGWHCCWRSSRIRAPACSCAVTASETSFATFPTVKPRGPRQDHRRPVLH